MICAGVTTTGSGVCAINRGAALYCNNRLEGVLSTGFSCGTVTNTPGVYSQVFIGFFFLILTMWFISNLSQVRYYLNWIEEQVRRQDIPPSNVSPIERMPWKFTWYCMRNEKSCKLITLIKRNWEENLCNFLSWWFARVYAFVIFLWNLLMLILLSGENRMFSNFELFIYQRNLIYVSRNVSYIQGKYENLILYQTFFRKMFEWFSKLSVKFQGKSLNGFKTLNIFVSNVVQFYSWFFLSIFQHFNYFFVLECELELQLCWKELFPLHLVGQNEQTVLLSIYCKLEFDGKQQVLSCKRSLRWEHRSKVRRNKDLSPSFQRKVQRLIKL